MICSCVYDDYEKPSKENFTRKNSSLKGTSLGIFTLIIVLLCLLFAGFGFGDEGIRSLTWNRKNNDDANDALIFTFELKPASPSSAMTSHWNDSLDFYDDSAKMMKRQLNLEETKQFLERYRCEIRLPIVKVSPIYIFGNDVSPNIEFKLSNYHMSYSECHLM